ncbi:probable Pre-mRNA-splicing factor CWC26 [Ustilago trichophora]|uniref:Probable Pre-mRNA-splicing factor CWC26 n=1 Tax=Ustilago trichophora TaxID=86804 RepID=A0A5C3DNT1_9BASI|nr:probable Pre-mRNA-splicing factor CWC26 [Ustilago trichophora]
MPDPKLQAYLAAHYLSGPKADAILARTSDSEIKVKRKKKRSKTDASEAASSSSGIVFKDDSESWMTTAPGEEDEDGLTPQVVGGAAGDVKKGFRKVGGSGSKQKEEGGSGEASSSTQPTAAAGGDEPTTEFRAGLRTKEEMKAARLAREERKKREAATSSSSSHPTPHTASDDNDDEAARLAQTTVYRDNSGRVIDIAAFEAEQAALERSRQLKEAERKTWSQGLVQKQQQQAARSQLQSVQSQGIARRATDEDYNSHFKQQERADDPALAFLAKKRITGPQKPKYKGPYPPNRFNIAPGYRWDGVDRGNGFEKLLIERKSALQRREQEARAWGQSDM